jgi:hypothetical protein
LCSGFGLKKNRGFGRVLSVPGGSDVHLPDIFPSPFDSGSGSDSGSDSGSGLCSGSGSGLCSGSVIKIEKVRKYKSQTMMKN